MTQEELQKSVAQDKVEFIKPDKNQSPEQPTLDSMEEFIPLLISLRRFRKHVTTAPTFKPKTFADQVQLYDDGVNRRVYLYVNNSWRYVALT